MLGFLLKLKAVVPERYWIRLWQSYWNSFWQKEELKESKQNNHLGPLRYSERAVLVEAFASRNPKGVVLEIGCSYGQTIHILAPLFPNVHFVGIDIDQQRVVEGNQLLKNAGIANAELIVGDGRSLEQFSESSFDLVYSVAALLYFHPSDFSSAVENFLRVSRKGVLMLEMHCQSAGVGELRDERATKGSYWLRNYVQALKDVNCTVEIQPIDNPLWTTEFWQEKAALIDVQVQ